MQFTSGIVETYWILMLLTSMLSERMFKLLLESQRNKATQTLVKKHYPSLTGHTQVVQSLLISSRMQLIQVLVLLWLLNSLRSRTKENGIGFILDTINKRAKLVTQSLLEMGQLLQKHFQVYLGLKANPLKHFLVVQAQLLALQENFSIFNLYTMMAAMPTQRMQ